MIWCMIIGLPATYLLLFSYSWLIDIAILHVHSAVSFIVSIL